MAKFVIICNTYSWTTKNRMFYVKDMIAYRSNDKFTTDKLFYLIK